jgi:hypothetical protein
MHRKHTAHLLLEVDVTRAQEALRAHEARTGQDVSLTAVVTGCVARAVAENTAMHAYRIGRSRLMLFDDVDVALLLEQPDEYHGVEHLHRSPERTPHIIRAANTKRLDEIEQEIRAARTERSSMTAWLPFWLLLPAPARTLVWKGLLARPRLRKRLTGTVAVSSVDVLGSRTDASQVESTSRRWAIPLVAHTLAVELGGIVRKPGLAPGSAPAAVGTHGARERPEIREYLCLTISIDDDVVGGGQAARFAERLRALIEGDASFAMLPPDQPAVQAPAPDAEPRAVDRAARAAAAVTAIKSIHTVIFLAMASCVGYILYSGIVGRFSGLAKLAMLTLSTEGVIYSRNGFRCPLADMAEDLGAESGTVGDIFLPSWVEPRIPVISSALLAVAGSAYWLRRLTGLTREKEPVL